MLEKAAAKVEANYGTGSPAAGVNPDYFSIDWFGKFGFKATNYTFSTWGDDHVRVIVDKQLILNTSGTANITLPMTSGTHDVIVEYAEGVGEAGVKLTWAESAQSTVPTATATATSSPQPTTTATPSPQPTSTATPSPQPISGSGPNAVAPGR